ncbi:hypothetical protein JCM6882_005451 [Rhodosporidiobolus microsporus]
MDSDHSTIISDSEPEGYPTSSAAAGAGGTSVFLARMMREAAKQEAEERRKEQQRTSRRRTSDERPGMSATEDSAAAAQGKGKEVIVLSSEEDSEGEDKKPSTSRYFAPSGTNGTKRRRVPSSRPAGEGWPSLASLDPTYAETHSPPRPSASSHSRDSSLEVASRSPRASTSGRRDNFDKVARPSPAPFVSALDLLRSTPTQPSAAESEEEDVKPKKDKGKGKAKEKKAPRPRPTVKKASSAGISKRRSASVSSMEVVDETTAEQDDDDEDDRRSIASTSSSTSSLPDPSSWKERFQFGAKSSRDSLSKADVKPKKSSKLESQAQSQGQGPSQRKKPWEDLETMIANRPRVKPPAPPKTTRAKVKKVVKAESLSLSDDDDDAIIIGGSASAVASTSTAFHPVPPFRSTSSSTSTKRSTTSTSKKPTPAPLSFLPAPLALPADDRIRALTSCVLCGVSWPTTKSLSVRQTHLRTCASKQLHTAETVALLVDDEVLRLADAAEERRREREQGLSLFDRAVGKGEGGNPWREVTVVGVEELLAGADAGEWTRKTKKVQEELDQGRRKDKVEKVVKVAKEIRRERAAAAEGEGVKAEDDDGKVKDEDVDDAGSPFPAATGRLRPDSDSARAALAQRASEMLGLAGGTGLTQAAGAGSASRVEERSGRDSDEEAEMAVEEDEFASPPRPTQAFEPSDLAARYEVEGRADVVRLSSKPVNAAVARSRSPFLSDDDEGEEGARAAGSLWKSAAGREEDDEVVRRVVSPRPPSSLPSPPSPARSFRPPRHSRPSSVPLPTALDVNNDHDLGIGLSPSSARLFSTLALSSPSTASSPGSPTRSRSRARTLAHPYSPFSPRSFRSASPVSPTRSLSRGSSAGRLPPPPPRGSARTSSPSPRTARTTQEMERLGLGEREGEGARGGLEEGETVGAWEAEEGEEAGWRDEVEDWMMEGGASPGRSSERGDLERRGREMDEEETSEEEPLASATKRARKTTTTTNAHPPSSPTPAAARTTKKTTTKSITSRRRKAAPLSPAASDADDFAFHSGDSLPPPPRRPAAATKPKAATKSRPAAASASPALAPPADLDPAGMPAYSTFALTKLQKEVAKYGFRPSKEKSVMVDQMRSVWRALNSDAVASAAAGPALVVDDPPTPVKQRRKRLTKAAATEAVGDDSAPKPKGRGRKKKAVAASDEEGDGAVEVDSRTPGEKLRELILADEELYCRILRYEPIHFDEFTALAKAGGLKIAQQLLMRCLDEQSITFYTQDPTNGSRRRYK